MSVPLSRSLTFWLCNPVVPSFIHSDPQVHLTWSIACYHTSSAHKIILQKMHSNALNLWHGREFPNWSTGDLGQGMSAELSGLSPTFLLGRWTASPKHCFDILGIQFRQRERSKITHWLSLVFHEDLNIDLYGGGILATRIPVKVVV